MAVNALVPPSEDKIMPRKNVTEERIREKRASPKVNSAVNSRWKSRMMRWKPSQKVTLQTKASKTSSVKRVRLPVDSWLAPFPHTF